MPKDSHFHKLKKKWLRRHREYKRKILDAHSDAIDWVTEGVPAKETIAGSAVGALMLANTLPSTVSIPDIRIQPQVTQENTITVDTSKELVKQLDVVLPKETRALSADEEVLVSNILSSNFGMPVKADINGLRLNRSYGLIGAEQHLIRYPGDTMAGHLDIDDAKNKLVYSSGMAPGRGAWGYFANSKAEMDSKAVDREKWYIAVQSFLAPDYNRRLGEYRDFFKNRKMLLVNTKTGQAVVSDIADAGPAQWTGKHLGGSPEVMQALGYHSGPRKGPVLYFFIDDPGDTIPLGPVKAV